MSKRSNIGLEISFEATADSTRLSAHEIAARVGLAISTILNATDVKVEVHGSFLDFSEAYAREKAETEVETKPILPPDRMN